MGRKSTGSDNGVGANGNGQRVTLKFLARHLDLSPTTISVVISDSPLAGTIAQKTKDRIWEAVREFNYRPNVFARYLHGKRTYCVAVLVPDIGDEFSASLISGIEKELAKQGYFYFVVSHRGAPELIEKSPDTLLDRGVEGMIFINTPLKRSLSVPVVAISDITEAPDVSRIVIDNARAATLALKHLSKLGHRKIAVLRGPRGNGDSEDRWQSLQKAADELGIAIAPKLTRELGKYPECNNTSMSDLGYHAAKELLQVSHEFTALVAFNDGSAIGAIRAFRDAGLTVPNDISVIGFDDIEQAAFNVPRLTTIRQPLLNMGELAARTLIKRIEAPGEKSREVLVEPKLVARESTAAPPATHRPNQFRSHDGTRHPASHSSLPESHD
ncbi:MAG TPA: LacI family DNA-binding transcriptional regulator [Terriglobales bacterium]|nr:LacI family DNA-binding transcriptional regulator [Terriglobales bacterium]